MVSEMKTLIFDEGLLLPTLSGSKRFTIRRYREEAHNLTKDDLVLGEFKEGFTIILRITKDTKKATFRELKKKKSKLRKNGYYFDKKYFDKLKKYYPDITWDTVGAIIFYEVPRVDGIPTVSTNKHS